MRYVLLLVTFVLGWILPARVEAQQAFRFNHLTVDDILTQGDIASIVQDRQGFMWLGASDHGGLMKFDGYGLTIYKHDAFDSTSLSYNRPFTITEAREDGLWIGTWDGGLNYFDPVTERFTHYRHDPANPNSLSTDFSAFLHEGQDGHLWVLSIVFGSPIKAYLDRLDPATGIVTRFRHDPTDPQSLSQDLVTFTVLGVMVYPAFDPAGAGKGPHPRSPTPGRSRRRKSRDARRTRPDEDPLLRQYLARVSHAADAHPRTAAGHSRRRLRRRGCLAAPAHLSLMQRNGARLLRLINQLLDLSKLEAGSTTLRARRANLVPFLQRIVGIFTARARQNGITLHFSASEQDLFLYFEPDKLEKVFINLLSNAFKFTPEGGTIRIEAAQRTGEVIEVVVADTGPGIPADALPHIFDRFHQVDGSSTRAHEGTGIGLALVKELVTVHGGTVRVESEVGRGTAFYVRLRPGTAHLGEAEILDEGTGGGMLEIVEGESGGLEASLQLVDAMVQAEAASSRKDAPLVLIVEDHDDVRAYLKSHLAPLYRVEEAADGEQGLTMARQTQPALVISDVMMPQMDGYQLCHALKTDEALNHIPVVLLTARADEESKVEGLETGADDYLYKPFSAAELLVRVENLIEIRRRLRQRFSKEVVAVAPSEIEVTSVDAAFLEQVHGVVEAHLGNSNFGVDWLADEMALSKRQLQRRLRALTGLSAAGYIRTMRLQRAAQLLEQGGGTVAEVAYAVGFQKVPHFSKLFRQVFGVTSSKYPVE